MCHFLGGFFLQMLGEDLKRRAVDAGTERIGWAELPGQKTSLQPVLPPLTNKNSLAFVVLGRQMFLSAEKTRIVALKERFKCIFFDFCFFLICIQSQNVL